MTTQQDERARLIKGLRDLRDVDFDDLFVKAADMLDADGKAGGEAVARVIQDGATVRLEWASSDAAHNAKPGPLYTHFQPQAVAQGWKLPYVDRSEAVNLARNYLYSSLCKPLTQAGAEILAHAVLKMDAAMLSASPAAPVAAKPDVFKAMQIDAVPAFPKVQK